MYLCVIVDWRQTGAVCRLAADGRRVSADRRRVSFGGGPAPCVVWRRTGAVWLHPSAGPAPCVVWRCRVSSGGRRVKVMHRAAAGGGAEAAKGQRSWKAAGGLEEELLWSDSQQVGGQVTLNTLSSDACRLFSDWSKLLNCSSNLRTLLLDRWTDGWTHG